MSRDASGRESRQRPTPSPRHRVRLGARGRDRAREATRDFSLRLDEFVSAELTDPDRFRKNLEHLDALLADTRLTRALFSADEIFSALATEPRTAAPRPDGEPVSRHRLLARLATVESARLAIHLLAEHADELEQRPRAPGSSSASFAVDDQAALLVGRLLLEQWLASDAPPWENAVWRRIAVQAFEDHLRSGAALVCAGRATARAIWRSNQEAWSQGFAHALRDPVFAADVLGRRLDPRPVLLAERLERALDRGRLSRLPVVHVDGVLHLCHENVAFLEERADQIWRQGLQPADLDRLEDAIDEAYRADATPDLVREIVAHAEAATELGNLGETLADGSRPSEADLDEAAALLAVRALPVPENPVLRGAYLRSFELVQFCFSDEWPFVARLWAEPGNLEALATYERYLLARGEVDRARRVIRFARGVRLATSQEHPPAPSA